MLTCDKPGKYWVRKFEVKNPKVICFMVHTMMCIDESAYHTVGSLNNAALFFSFAYTVDKTDLMDDGSFIFEQFIHRQPLVFISDIPSGIMFSKRAGLPKQPRQKQNKLTRPFQPALRNIPDTNHQ